MSMQLRSNEIKKIEKEKNDAAIKAIIKAKTLRKRKNCCVNMTSQEYVCYNDIARLDKYKHDLFIGDGNGDTRWNNTDVLRYIKCNTPLYRNYVDIYFSKIVL